MHRAANRIYPSLMALILGVMWIAPTHAQDSMKRSLYERLGGVHAIAAVVDDFADRLLKNQVIFANSKVVEAVQSGRITGPGIKYLVTEQICSATGGPQKYTGRSMIESHKHLGITEKEWEAGGADLKATLDKFKVPEQEQQELFALIGSIKKDIVVSSEDQGAMAGEAKSSESSDEKAGDIYGAKSENGEKKSLYERLGGVQTIAAVVDDFTNRLLKNKVILSNPKVVEAAGSGRITVAGLKFLLTEQISEAAGGPQRYTGRSMKESHKHLDISEREWRAGAADLRETFKQFKVPRREQRELFAILEKIKPDIVAPEKKEDRMSPYRY